MKSIVFLFLVLAGEVFAQTAPVFKWQDFSIGKPALSLKVPMAPKPQNKNIPESVMQTIRTYDGYFIKDETRGLVITMMHVDYSADITADVGGAVQGTISQWKNSGAQVHIRMVSMDPLSGKSAIRQIGTFVQNGQENQFANVVVGEGSKLWQVIIIAKVGDADLRSVMDTMLSSLAFK